MSKGTKIECKTLSSVVSIILLISKFACTCLFIAHKNNGKNANYALMSLSKARSIK